MSDILRVKIDNAPVITAASAWGSLSGVVDSAHEKIDGITRPIRQLKDAFEQTSKPFDAVMGFLGGKKWDETKEAVLKLGNAVGESIGKFLHIKEILDTVITVLGAIEDAIVSVTEVFETLTGQQKEVSKSTEELIDDLNTLTKAIESQNKSIMDVRETRHMAHLQSVADTQEQAGIDAANAGKSLQDMLRLFDVDSAQILGFQKRKKELDEIAAKEKERRNAEDAALAAEDMHYAEGLKRQQEVAKASAERAYQAARAHEALLKSIEATQIDLALTNQRLLTNSQAFQVLGNTLTAEQNLARLRNAALDTNKHGLETELEYLQRIAKARSDYAGALERQRQVLDGIASAQASEVRTGLQLAQTALQAQSEGWKALTDSEKAALGNLESYRQQLSELVDTEKARLLMVKEELASGNVTEERRLQLLQKQAQLTQAIAQDEAAQRSANQAVQDSEKGYRLAQQATEDYMAAQKEAANVGKQFEIQFAQVVGTTTTGAQAMAKTAAGAFQSLTTSFKAHLAAVITGKETIGEALKGMLHETLLSVATESAVQAILETAKGIASLATQNYPAAGQHFAAAGAFTAAAIAAGVGAAATVPTPPPASQGSGSTHMSGVSGAQSGGQSGGGLTINLHMSGSPFATQRDLHDGVMQAVKIAKENHPGYWGEG